MGEAEWGGLGVSQLVIRAGGGGGGGVCVCVCVCVCGYSSTFANLTLFAHRTARNALSPNLSSHI